MLPGSTTKVRLQDEVRPTVVFLGHGSPDGGTFDPVSTAFVVIVTDRIRAAPYVSLYKYLVTNKHCVNEGLSLPFHIRFNRKGSAVGFSQMDLVRGRGSVLQHVEEPEWHFHSDPNVDLAVMEIEPPPDAGFLGVPIDMALSSERLSVGDIGTGDLTYTVGLFKYRSGKERNLPLVHTGHIATVPEDERITVEDWEEPDKGKTREIEGYIVQCPVMPGGSGSPVFVRKPLEASHRNHSHDFERRHGQIVEPNMHPPLGYGALFLLGIWQSSWELKHVRFVGQVQVRDPAGYGVVIPAHKLIEILDMPRLKERREVRKNQLNEENPAKADSGVTRSADEPFRKVVRKTLDTPPDPRVTNK